VSVLLLALLLPACASAPPIERPAARAAQAEFAVGRDTFAFPNLVRANTPGRPHDFANYCIIMARGASQFFRFARFAPDESPRPDADYTRLTGEVLAITPWEAPWPAERRVVIPGYADLHAFSRGRESAIKAAFGNQWPGVFAFRNWRVVWSQSGAHQAGLAHELVEEVGSGRPVPLFITSFPVPDYVNHVVLVYDYRPSAGVVEFLAYDPNDPDNPLSLHFDPVSRAFWIEAVPYGPAGRIRAFRLFGSPLL
jgi:hypothetical protein